MATAKGIPQTSLFETLSPETNLCSSTPPAPDARFREIEAERHRKLSQIGALDQQLTAHFQRATVIEKSLTRQLVSFQANKLRPAFRWYKYKEAFSAPLVELLISRCGIKVGPILDPFAGAGTALFVASDMGIDSEGIELLPIGQQIIQARLLSKKLTRPQLDRLSRWVDAAPWRAGKVKKPLPELKITAGAYPSDTKEDIERYLASTHDELPPVRQLLHFALLCILEEVGYTRKDGQYLRWDHRSGRRAGEKLFDKGKIAPFETAVSGKIRQILNDVQSDEQALGLFSGRNHKGSISLSSGSCLEKLPELPADRYTGIFTSPPYCNRYDYTRTYALELALLGVNEQQVVALRQAMLSCTVENRQKDIASINSRWSIAIEAADQTGLLQAILAYLNWCRDSGLLNNSGISRMVRGYFYEMACVIAECHRVLKRDAPLVMVNDNVRYAGASVSVDLILSGIAEALGFKVEKILVLPQGKGNSSQQMGAHGRDALRKCVYIWRKK